MTCDFCHHVFVGGFSWWKTIRPRRSAQVYSYNEGGVYGGWPIIVGGGEPMYTAFTVKERVQWVCLIMEIQKYYWRIYIEGVGVRVRVNKFD